MRGPLTAFLILTALLLIAPAPATAAHDRTEQRLVALVAADRAAHGLPALRVSRRLARAADRHARRLARAGVLRHRTDRWLLRAARSNWTGEVLARAPSVRLAFAAWLRSPPHRTVLRSDRARRIGVAVRGNIVVAQLAGTSRAAAWRSGSR